MRTVACLIALTLIPAPAFAARKDDRRPRPAARGESRPAPPPRSDRGAARPAPPPAYGGDRGAARPAPPPAYGGDRAASAPPWMGRSRTGARAAPAPAPWTSPRYRGYPVPVYRPWAWYSPWYAEFWLGWGWGWGYAPLYPRRPYYEPQQAREESERITTRLGFTAGIGENDAAFGGVALGIDGRNAGFHVGVDAVQLDRGDRFVDEEAVGWGSMHVTWTVAGSEAYRVRLEAGASMLSMPDTGSWVGRPYAGTIAFGPDFGVSAQLGLVGPLGVEAHARVTPFPVPVTDLRVALALRGGPFALTVGARSIDVRGDEVDAPDGRFGGPEVGFGLVF